jgi:hypothetical protein
MKSNQTIDTVSTSRDFKSDILQAARALVFAHCAIDNSFNSWGNRPKSTNFAVRETTSFFGAAGVPEGGFGIALGGAPGIDSILKNHRNHRDWTQKNWDLMGFIVFMGI